MTYLLFEGSAPRTCGTDMAVSEVLGMLSYALDLTEGQPEGHIIRCAWIGTRIGEELGLDAAAQADLLFTLLLKDTGCSSNAARICALFQTDDITFKRNFKIADGKAAQNACFVTGKVGGGLGLLRRIARVVKIAGKADRIGTQLIATRCERGAEIAARLRFSTEVQNGVRSLDEHWDGSGKPSGLRGPAISRLSNIALLAQVVDVFHTAAGAAAATREVISRSGTWFDPALIAAFERVARSPEFWLILAHPQIEKQVFALPAAQQSQAVTQGWLDDIALAFADIIDAKSPYTADHSRRVTHFADLIAEEMGFSDPHRRWLRRAALLHDLGKLAVSNQILDKPGGLDEAEWEVVRSHPRQSERLLAQVGALRDIAPVAGGHHERLDGKGYPRGLQGSQICIETRILTVADVFDALSAARPYRPAVPVDQVFEMMESEVGTAFDGRCLRALKGGMKRISARAA